MSVVQNIRAKLYLEDKEGEALRVVVETGVVDPNVTLTFRDGLFTSIQMITVPPPPPKPL